MSIYTTESNDAFESAREDLSSICADDLTSQPAPLPSLDQEMLRNHSFQLVKLQNDLCELRAQQAKDLRTTTHIMSQMADLYASIAELKGKLTGLTVDLHLLQDATLADLLSGGGLEDLADCVMKEQRESLIRALVSK
ncbi:hypothetical protein ESCO_003961 [Escovopsis weberi]|uniref:Uncharacterized protein n=1 Tax=Escovopsis weberi TaxID=150374 RepID=A0A0M9VXN5_ESCWE|nr:hypothetical protein ESCO_003961 [Escovopsis weberi]